MKGYKMDKLTPREISLIEDMIEQEVAKQQRKIEKLELAYREFQRAEIEFDDEQYRRCVDFIAIDKRIATDLKIKIRNAFKHE